MAGGGSADGVKAGRAYVEVGTDNKPLDVGLDMAAKRLKAFGAAAVNIGSQLAGVGLGIGAGLVAAAVSFANAGSDLADMSQRTGDTAANLSAIGFAAQQSGSDIETLEAGLSKMSATIAGAAAGEKASLKMLRDLGLSADDLAGKLPTGQLAMFADKIAGIQDNSTKIDVTKAIFGKAGTKLLPLLNQGSAGIAELTAEARKLGLVMSDEDVAAADALGDSFDKLKASVGAVVVRIGAQLAPIINKLADYLTGVAGSVSKFVADNKGLIIGIGIAAVALVGLGSALVAIGVAATVAGVAMTGLGVVVAVVTSPFTLMAVAIGGALAALVHFTGVGGDLVDGLKERFSGLLAAIGDVRSLMGDMQEVDPATENAGAGTSIVDKLLSLPGALKAGLDGVKLLGETGVLNRRDQAAAAIRQVQPAVAANARGSAGAASSIASAINSQPSIDQQLLVQIGKLVVLTEKMVKKPPVTFTELG